MRVFLGLERAMYSKSSLIACDLYVEVDTEVQKNICTTNPNGRANVPKLLGKEDAFWEKQADSKSFEKSVIVISDWSLATHRLEKEELRWIFCLMDLGFEIYAWTGKLVKIDSQYELEANLKNIQPIHPKQLEIILSQNEIEKDSIKIVDYFERRRISAILEFNKSIEPSLNFTEIENVSSATLLESIIASLSDYLFFEIYLFIHQDLENYELLKKLASLPQSKGINFSTNNSLKNENFMRFLKQFPYYFRKIDLYQSSAEIFNNKELKNIKAFAMKNEKNHLVDLSQFSDQLQSIKLKGFNFNECQFSSFHSLQKLSLSSFTNPILYEIGVKAPNLEVLQLNELYYSTNENKSKLEFIKLKKLTLNKIWLPNLLKKVNLPSQIEELTLNTMNLDSACIDINEIEKITQLRKLSCKDLSISADYLITLIKNNIYLEELRLENVDICSESSEERISLIQILQSNSQYLLSLRSMTILQEDFSELPNFIVNFLKQVPMIEETIFKQSSQLNNKATILYQKNHQILLKGEEIDPAILEPFITHSDYVHFLSIKGLLMDSIWVKDLLVGNKDKLTQIKTLELPESLEKEYIELFPSLKNIKLKKIRLSRGSLTIWDDMDFQLLFKLDHFNNSILSELVITHSKGKILNEALFFDYDSDFPFKSLRISNFDFSAKICAKLITRSPHLKFLHLENNVDTEIIDCLALSKSLDGLILKGLLEPSIFNILVHKPLVKLLEIELPENNESIIELLILCIAASTQLKHLIIKGEFSAKLSERFLNLIINKQYKMDTLILGSHFVFIKDRELKVEIPLGEDYLIDLVRSSTQIDILQIAQPIPIEMFAGCQFKRLSRLKIISCLDSLTSTRTLSEVFDFLISHFPKLGKYTVSEGISVNLYRENSYFIVNEDNKKRRLQTTERLSNRQVSAYIDHLKIEALDIPGFDGLLALQEEKSYSSFSCNLQDTSSLLANLELLIIKSNTYDCSLKSPHLKITKDKLEWHGDKLSDDEIQKVIKLSGKFYIKNISIHNKLSLNVAKMLDQENFYEINLIEVNNQEEILVSLMKTRVEYTARNAHYQVLYKYKELNDQLLCSGICFPPSLLSLLLSRKHDKYFYTIKLEDFSFGSSSPSSLAINYDFHKLFLKNTNLKIDFLENWLANSKFSYKVLTVENCPNISHSQLEKLESEYPPHQLSITHLATVSITEPRSMPRKQGNLLSSIDAITGEQPWQNLSFNKENSSDCFRKKKEQPSLANYLRLIIQNDGPKNIRLLKNIPYRNDVTGLYETNYENQADYYLAEPKLILEKNTWLSLPSKTPEDRLVACYASEQLDWGYSDEENLFYIRSIKSCEVKLSYLIRGELDIRFKDEEEIDNYQTYFPCIQAIDFEASKIDSLFQNQFSSLLKKPRDFIEELLIAFCRFDAGDLSNPSLKGKSLFNLLIRERKGSCRHNVFAFNELKTFFNQNLPPQLRINARAAWSSNHVIIEMKKNNKWQMICLGGLCIPQVVDNQEELLESRLRKKPRLKKILPSEAQKIESNSSLKSVKLRPIAEANPQKNDQALVEVPLKKPLIQVVELKPGADVIDVEPEKALQAAKDFSYVLSLNPFNQVKQPKFLSANDFSDLINPLIALSEELRAGEKNLLLNFESAVQIEDFYAAFSSSLTARQKRFLLMHQPNQFNPSEFVIDAKTGETVSQVSALVKTIGLAQSGDFLIINLTQYNDKTVSLLNALAERKNRMLANLPIPEELTILAVKFYHTALSEDVYSRFVEQEYFVPKLKPTNSFNSFCTAKNPEMSNKECLEVDFYDGASWKAQLIGSLELEGQQVKYKEGALIEMIKSGKQSIRFYNPPMALDEFRVALITLLHTGEFDANGEIFYLPAHFSYESVTKNYDLASPEYSYLLIKQSSQKEGSYVLNSTTFYHFFNNFQCDEGQFNPTVGWLAQYAHQEINLWVTSLLHESLWAKLFDLAKIYQCLPVLSFESSLFMPQSMRKRVGWQEQRLDQPKKTQNYIIVANDIHFAALQCQLEDEGSAVIFAVNETTQFSNLFELIKLKKDVKDLAVDWQSCPIREHLLQEGERVILKGNINKELADKLQSLFSAENSVFVNGKKETYKSQLILIVSENKYFKSATVIQQNYHFDDFYQHLTTQYPENLLSSWHQLLQSFLAKVQSAGIELHLSYPTLESMLIYYRQRPKSNPLVPFILLDPNYKALKKIALAVISEEKTVFSSANDFDQQRKQAVDQMLDIFASGFLVGASGVGKTTFVNKNFAPEELHVGLNELVKWAQEGGTFYLDEINLYPRGSLDFFAGLFNSNPGLLMDGQFYPIKLGDENKQGSKIHRLIVGGNYSDFANRQKHDFLQQVPVIEFMDFPDWYLKERVLKKAMVISYPFDEEKLAELMDILLRVYHYVNEQNPKAQWTIRNLENMALRFMLFREERPEQSVELAAWFSAYDEVSNHNKTDWISFFQKWIEAQFPLYDVITQLNEQISHKTNSFILTQCRKNLFRLMQDQIKIQELKTRYPELSDFGAVCGFLLEGEAAVGKTKTATELAISLGYKNGDDPTQKKAANSKYYYVISLTDEAKISGTMTKETNSELDLSPIEKKLTRLFHEGALIIFDEINSSNNLEKIFNALMSGYDLALNRAKNPGFFVFASGNPIHYIGRKILGLPLENRMFKMEVLDYSQNGLEQIATHEGLHPFFAKASAAFFHKSTKSKSNSKSSLRGYLDKIEFIKKNNPLSTWLMLEEIYGYLGGRDRAALYCTSLFSLSAFAFLHQSALLQNSITENRDSFSSVSENASIEEELIVDENPFVEKEFLLENEAKFEEIFEVIESSQLDDESLSANQKVEEQNDASEQNSCITALSMQILGGTIAVLGIAAVALAFTVLNASTLGIGGVVALAIGAALILAGVGFFAKGMVDNCRALDSDPLSLDPRSIYDYQMTA